MVVLSLGGDEATEDSISVDSAGSGTRQRYCETRTQIAVIERIATIASRLKVAARGGLGVVVTTVNAVLGSDLKSMAPQG